MAAGVGHGESVWGPPRAPQAGDPQESQAATGVNLGLTDRFAQGPTVTLPEGKRDRALAFQA